MNKPEIINGIEVPCPVLEQLTVGTKYTKVVVAYEESTWNGWGCDIADLQNGLIHLTKEAAIAHAEALLRFTRGDK